MARAKKTKLSLNAAQQLEEMLGDAAYHNCVCFGNPRQYIEVLLREVGCPKADVAKLVSHLDTVIGDMHDLEKEPSRANAEAVVDSFQRLDAFLARTFSVRGTQREPSFKWAVGS